MSCIIAFLLIVVPVHITTITSSWGDSGIQKQVGNVLKAVSTSTEYYGHKVSIKDAGAFSAVVEDLIEELHTLSKDPINLRSIDLFSLALAYRVICEGADKVEMYDLSKKCYDQLTKIRNRHISEFQHKHPGIEELWLQVAKDIDANDIYGLRLQAALSGCRTSAITINYQCWGSDEIFDKYFSSEERAFVFGLTDMLFTARDDDLFHVHSSFPPIFIRCFKGDVILSNYVFDQDVDHSRNKFNLLMQEAWHHWNSRFSATQYFELNLAAAWRHYTRGNLANGSERGAGSTLVNGDSRTTQESEPDAIDGTEGEKPED